MSVWLSQVMVLSCLCFCSELIHVLVHSSVGQRSGLASILSLGSHRLKPKCHPGEAPVWGPWERIHFQVHSSQRQNPIPCWCWLGVALGKKRLFRGPSMCPLHFSSRELPPHRISLMLHISLTSSATRAEKNCFSRTQCG